ncbi:MAG: hypothetical protein ACI30R_07060 [Sodaliphilus sp.]
MSEPDKKGTKAGGPPATFAMPMYHNFVPKAIRPWIYLMMAFCFQISGCIYLGAMNNIVGQWGVMREDVQMCLYCTLIGMAVYFPMLFRMKFRFTNKNLLMVAACVVIVCNLLSTIKMPMPLLWCLCVVCGVAKLQGTFECFSNIQLWITPKRDFGVFFPVLHIVLLISMEVAGYLAAWFAFHAHWSHIHWVVMALMMVVLLIQALLTKPFHAMPKIVPLKGVDWVGGLLWCLLWLQVAWLLNYGDWLDWWHSPRFRFMVGTTLITLALLLTSMRVHAKPYIEPAMWTYHHAIPVILLIGVVDALFACEHVLEVIYYEEVMHYSDLTTEGLKLWMIVGILAGCGFALLWLSVMRWKVYKLIAFALLAFCIYTGSFYFLVNSGISITQLRIPTVWHGFSYAVLSIAFMWSLNRIMSFEHFFQSLSVFNALHMCVGGLMGAALHARGMKYYMADAFARCSGYIDSVRLSANSISLPQAMDGIVEGFMAQSVKIMFGWTLFGGIFFAMLMLFWDSPVRRQIKHIPSWHVVGMRLVRNLKKQKKAATT